MFSVKMTSKDTFVISSESYENKIKILETEKLILLSKIEKMEDNLRWRDFAVEFPENEGIYQVYVFNEKEKRNFIYQATFYKKSNAWSVLDVKYWRPLGNKPEAIEDIMQKKEDDWRDDVPEVGQVVRLLDDSKISIYNGWDGQYHQFSHGGQSNFGYFKMPLWKPVYSPEEEKLRKRVEELQQENEKLKKMPEWKKGVLEASSRSHNSEPRKPPDSQ